MSYLLWLNLSVRSQQQCSCTPIHISSVLTWFDYGTVTMVTSLSDISPQQLRTVFVFSIDRQSRRMPQAEAGDRFSSERSLTLPPLTRLHSTAHPDAITSTGNINTRIRPSDIREMCVQSPFLHNLNSIYEICAPAACLTRQTKGRPAPFIS